MVKTANQCQFDAIPVIDLQAWFGGSSSVKYGIAKRVNRVCREVGFMYVRNHGIPGSLIECAFKQTRSFFSLPEEEKLKIHYRRTGGHRGYLPMKVESSDPTAEADLKEAFDCGLVLQPRDSVELTWARMIAPNLWPENLPGFKEGVERYFNAVWQVAQTMFQIFAMSFGISEDFFDDKID
ncbi:MAG TPA: 2-oxoglutarate and iron-dependent oxygenase domain-containing protein, partial [Pyrinomonadaceae bacterium]|nr:2-oxoglutarate and iron-dependent oxygenase domain-containing protein [Pyrinomonadaceae bacterium]